MADKHTAPVSFKRLLVQTEIQWSDLPASIREHIKEQERELQSLRQLKPLLSVYERRKHVFEDNDIDFVDGIRSLIEAQARLDRDPIAGIKLIMRTYGLE